MLIRFFHDFFQLKKFHRANDRYQHGLWFVRISAESVHSRHAAVKLFCYGFADRVALAAYYIHDLCAVKTVQQLIHDEAVNANDDGGVENRRKTLRNKARRADDDKVDENDQPAVRNKREKFFEKQRDKIDAARRYSAHKDYSEPDTRQSAAENTGKQRVFGIFRKPRNSRGYVYQRRCYDNGYRAFEKCFFADEFERQQEQQNVDGNNKKTYRDIEQIIHYRPDTRHSRNNDFIRCAERVYGYGVYDSADKDNADIANKSDDFLFHGKSPPI